MKTDVKNKILIRTGLIFMAIGLIGMVLPFVTFGFFRTLAETEAGDSLYQQHLVYAQALPNPSVSPTPIPDYELKSVVDRIKIPIAGVDMPLFQSENINVLSKGGWLFPKTSTPGTIGNTVIFGHRFRYLPPISNTFFSLDKVKVGDTFTVIWKGQNYTYSVSEIKVIEPTDLSVLEQTADERITIVTCTPTFSTKQRLVVIGMLVK